MPGRDAASGGRLQPSRRLSDGLHGSGERAGLVSHIEADVVLDQSVILLWDLLVAPLGVPQTLVEVGHRSDPQARSLIDAMAHKRRGAQSLHEP